MCCFCITIIDFLLCLLIPPLAVFMHTVDCNRHVAFTIFLCLFGWLPGTLYALYFVFFRKEEREDPAYYVELTKVNRLDEVSVQPSVESARPSPFAASIRSSVRSSVRSEQPASRIARMWNRTHESAASDHFAASAKPSPVPPPAAPLLRRHFSPPQPQPSTSGLGESSFRRSQPMTNPNVVPESLVQRIKDVAASAANLPKDFSELTGEDPFTSGMFGSPQPEAVPQVVHRPMSLPHYDEHRVLQRTKQQLEVVDEGGDRANAADDEEEDIVTPPTREEEEAAKKRAARSKRHSLATAVVGSYGTPAQPTVAVRAPLTSTPLRQDARDSRLFPGSLLDYYSPVSSRMSRKFPFHAPPPPHTPPPGIPDDSDGSSFYC
ncbi:hypothetical protein M3Y99_00388500 [Aphelenchoides fujianensis]|nr:hypothetical protein M3Y99_01422600 [Aphelenchoides fujianensis]KAI6241156.1 hypothetical protein M3Y99_00388500 [Aphelenchoides fujianensis]